ncbi:hypothetical protein QJS83_00090 [Bdellovibrio sp. 22V]|uniref:hypothetical protein n=1 Tax=Bdellovibrio TaxID=958 RepID=UPI0025434ACC|nr:hypothetical protein [Bdellovibrio sp. 22V]WII72265.1 hypothetical protein QJS83_00090 [Bdellovibrio sp. 22V]
METVLENKNEMQNFFTGALNTTAPYKFLVVEDDESQWPLWENIIKTTFPNSEVDYQPTEAGAEALLRHSFHVEQPYDVVISDIFLEGDETGIDLWTRFGEVSGHFVFVSSMTLGSFDSIINNIRTSSSILPVYLQKPLSSRLCKEVIKSLL